MNQILIYKGLEETAFKKNRKSVFVYFFYISILLFILTLLYLCVYYYKLNQNNIKSKNLLQSFNISSLYANNNKYNSSYMYTTQNLDSFVIGIIEIDKINLHYPILSYSTESNLKISPCRFAGPMPNEVGNICIACHNNIDNSFFGKLNLLNNGDIVKIYDISGNMVKYSIYEKYEVLNTDFSCASQDTYGQKIVTLMTCNSLKDTRIIFRAAEITT